MLKQIRYFISFFCILNILYSTESKSHVYIKYVDQIIDSFIEQTKEEYNLICIGDGGSMPYDVQSIRVRFQTDKQLSTDEARALEVKTIQKLLALVNSNEKIRPYLRDYPFPAKRIDVSISINNSKKFLNGFYF